MVGELPSVQGSHTGGEGRYRLVLWSLDPDVVSI